jgi:cell division protein FtsL
MVVILVIAIVIIFHASDRYRRLFDYHVELKNEVERINTELEELKKKINVES